MAQPYNYTIARPDLGSQVLKGLQAVQMMQNIKDVSESQRQEESYRDELKNVLQGSDKKAGLTSLIEKYPNRAQTTSSFLNTLNQEEYKKDLQNTLNDGSPSSIDKFILKHPSQADKLKSVFERLEKNQKEGEIKQTSEVYSALNSGNIGSAINMLDRRIEAMSNSGQDTSRMERIKELIKEDPVTARGYIGVTLAGLMGADNFKKTFETIGQSTYKTLTEKEKKAMGLPVDAPFQISPTGKISQIGGGGVTVNVRDEEPKFGPIPQGYQRVKEGDTYVMTPIKGSPQEQKIKALAAKKHKAKSQASRTGNIVLKDLDRLKDKIENAPWYSPVAGVTAQYIPDMLAQNRVDAENLKQTIVSNIGFDKLQRIRESSPTGGGLGNITDKDIQNLQSVLGNLSLSQSEDQLISNIDRLNTLYEDILKKAAAYPNAEEFGFGSPDGQKEESDQDIYKRYGL